MPDAPPSLAHKKVLVMGLGRFGGGVGVAKWLVQQGAQVTVNDAAKESELTDSIQKLAGLPITFKLGGHDPQDFCAADLLIINPAVDKQNSPALQAALAQGIPFTTEINLFAQRCPALTIGITGSVGKSTTSTLIYEALLAGFDQVDRNKGPNHQPNPIHSRVFLGGNIGKSLLLDLPAIRSQDVVVLELSSFMLEDTPLIQWSPNIAVVTNIYPNHLDRHHTMAEYSAAKQNILKFQKPTDVAIFNNDLELVSSWAELAKGRVIKYTTRDLPKLPLVIPGDHNQSNARAALAVIDALPEYPAKFKKKFAMASINLFPGLAHRLQWVHTVKRGANAPLQFYNDSKATTPEASLTAIAAFNPHTAIFIVGGYDKHIDLSPFEKQLAAHAGGVIGIGQTGAAITEQVRSAKGPISPNRIAYAETLAAAVQLAHAWASESPTLTAVVLSPASASWGQFTNYEERGATFVQFATAL